ncbi:MAG: hypothetical protein ACFFD4_11785 [Candidatus Odinarchaeota archaeon]
MVNFSILADILWIIVGFSWLILIVAGVFAALWIFQRMAEYSDSETLPNLVKFVGFFGVFMGLFSFIAAVGGFLVPYFTEPPPDYTKMSISTLTLLIVAGIILCIRPIKNVRWGALVSLAAGVLSMVVIILLKIFIFPNAGDIWLWVVIIILFVALGGFYFTIRMFEDLYILIGNILDSPPVAVLVGAICVIEGILVFFETSIWNLAMSLLGG